MTRDELRELAVEHATASRAAQGLPPTITDPTVLARVVSALLAAKTPALKEAS